MDTQSEIRRQSPEKEITPVDLSLTQEQVGQLMTELKPILNMEEVNKWQERLVDEDEIRLSVEEKRGFVDKAVDFYRKIKEDEGGGWWSELGLRRDQAGEAVMAGALLAGVTPKEGGLEWLMGLKEELGCVIVVGGLVWLAWKNKDKLADLPETWSEKRRLLKAKKNSKRAKSRSAESVEDAEKILKKQKVKRVVGGLLAVMLGVAAIWWGKDKINLEEIFIPKAEAAEVGGLGEKFEGARELVEIDGPEQIKKKLTENNATYDPFNVSRNISNISMWMVDDGLGMFGEGTKGYWGKRGGTPGILFSELVDEETRRNEVVRWVEGLRDEERMSDDDFNILKEIITNENLDQVVFMEAARQVAGEGVYPLKFDKLMEKYKKLKR